MELLEKRGMLETYNAQIQDYLDRGVWKPVSMDQIRDWKADGNPLHYVSHHGVENSHSKSTPLRVVVNSATKNNHTGPSINDVYAKGPNSINSLYAVMVRWREFDEAMIYDISKAYHTMHTTDKELYMRLVVWRMSEDDDWQVFGHCVVGMGDGPASVFLELSKEKGAEAGEKIDPLAAKQLVKQGYVDDNCGGGTKDDVQRMRGEIIANDDGTYTFTGTVPKVLATIG